MGLRWCSRYKWHIWESMFLLENLLSPFGIASCGHSLFQMAEHPQYSCKMGWGPWHSEEAQYIEGRVPSTCPWVKVDGGETCPTTDA